MSNTPSTPGPSGPSIVIPPKTGIQRWLIPSLALVAAIVVGLFGGIIIGQSTATAEGGRTPLSAGFPGRTGGQTGQFGGPGGSGGFTAGSIVSINGNTIVVKTVQGTEVTVTASDSTTVTETKVGSLSDLKVGDEVTAIGKTGSDGKVAATSIAEGAVRQGFGQRGGTTNRTPSASH